MSISNRAPELRMLDVETFVQVMRAGSVNGAARGLTVGASQVSKALARLERHLGLSLFIRSARGVELTEDGRRVAPRLIDLVARAQRLKSPARRSALIVASPSFLWLVVAPRIASLLRRIRVHAVETSSTTMTAFASQPSFDVALAVGEERWPDSWVKRRAGVVRRALFATPAKARLLGKRVHAEALSRELFVGRFVSDHGQLVPSPDGCPMPARDRRFGHRAQTVAMALELAGLSDQLVFAPEIAARPFVKRRSLVQLQVEGWNVRDPLYVVCHQDRVEASVQRAFASAAEAALA
jgi:DNA-binding transcriptional LysR family regulator